ADAPRAPSSHLTIAAGPGAQVGVMHRIPPLPRTPWAWRRRFLAALVALPLLAALVGGCEPDARPVVDREESGDTRYDWSAPQHHHPDPNTLSVGVTHGEYSIDEWSHPEASASARAVLSATATYQNQ